jgi:hypothetical protein
MTRGPLPHPHRTLARRRTPAPASIDTRTRSGRTAAHHERDAFRSADDGPMRRDYALNRFLHLTAKYRRH